MSSSNKMTLSQLHKYWDALIKEVKELTARVAQLENKIQTTKSEVPTEKEKEVDG